MSVQSEHLNGPGVALREPVTRRGGERKGEEIGQECLSWTAFTADVSAWHTFFLWPHCWCSQRKKLSLLKTLVHGLRRTLLVYLNLSQQSLLWDLLL